MISFLSSNIFKGCSIMLKRNRFFLILGIIFVVLSAITYIIHYFIFEDLHHIFIYMVGDLAFLPLEVFIVGIVIERFISHREKQDMMQKLNMVIGAFFSELGNTMLTDLLDNFSNREEISRHLNVKAGWKRKDFQKASEYAFKLKIDIDYTKLDLPEIKTFLSHKRFYLLTLLENPTLLEHDRFTDLLWATTHVDEELSARTSFDNLPPEDLQHLGNDIIRMYDNLVSEWLDYVEHLKSAYPYLFSLIVRTHPFQEKPSAIISEVK